MVTTKKRKKLTMESFEVKNYESCRAIEGRAYSCNLYVDGKDAALVLQGGQGGDADMTWFDQDTEHLVESFIQTIPKRIADELFRGWESFKDAQDKAYPDGLVPWDMESFIEYLVDLP
jgi:hypothetical protein